MVDEIDVLESDEDADNMPCYSHAQKIEPIVIHGVGQLTMYVFSFKF